MKRFLGLLLVAGMAFGAVNAIPVEASHSLQDKDENAVIYGGIHDKSDLINKLNNGDGNPYGRSNDLREQFSSRQISDSDINGAVEGSVTKDGRVLVNNQVVATGAWAVGRQWMEGSQRNGDLWFRPTSVSFQRESLPALVMLDSNKKFHRAVIKACGNPVTANPVQAEAKQSFECRDLSAANSSGNAPLSVTFTAQAKAENVTIQSYSFDFGDGTTRVVTSSAASQTVNHTYNQPGTYTARVKITTSAGTTDYVTACQETITVRRPAAVTQAAPPPPPPTPPPAPPAPVSTPRTGGDLVGIIASGALSYGVYGYRRSRRDLKQALIEHRD
jgi:hypothetical protein